MIDHTQKDDISTKSQIRPLPHTLYLSKDALCLLFVNQNCLSSATELTNYCRVSFPVSRPTFPSVLDHSIHHRRRLGHFPKCTERSLMTCIAFQNRKRPNFVGPIKSNSLISRLKQWHFKIAIACYENTLVQCMTY